jgi:hypothetical protein
MLPLQIDLGRLFMANAAHEGARDNGNDSVSGDEPLQVFPPSRLSSFPPLAGPEEQDRFLRSPTAVLNSLGLRVPAALAQHLRRQSEPPAPHRETREAAISQTMRIPGPPAVPAEALPVAAAAAAVAAPKKKSRKAKKA